MTKQDVINKLVADLRVEIEPAPANPHILATDPDWTASHFFVKVANNGDLKKTFTFYYSCGSGHAERWLKEKRSMAYRQIDLDHGPGQPKARARAYVVIGKKLGFRPPLEDIYLQLCHIALDAHPNYYRDFQDWAESFGYDSDSIKALDTFHICQKQMKALHHVYPQDVTTWEAWRELLDN